MHLPIWACAFGKNPSEPDICRCASDNNPQRRGVADEVPSPDHVLFEVTSSPVSVFEVIIGAIQDVLLGHDGEALTATMILTAAPPPPDWYLESGKEIIRCRMIDECTKAVTMPPFESSSQRLIPTLQFPGTGNFSTSRAFASYSSCPSIS